MWAHVHVCATCLSAGSGGCRGRRFSECARDAGAVASRTRGPHPGAGCARTWRRPVVRRGGAGAGNLPAGGSPSVSRAVPASPARVVATEHARRVFRLANEEARSSRAAALGSEHVLIAVLASGGDAARALIDAGATLEHVRASDRAMTAEPAPPSGFRRPAAGVRQLLREATQRAISRGEHWLDVTGLLLAALADPDGGARRVLAALDVDVPALRARLERDADSWQPEARAAARRRRSGVG